MAQIVGNGCRAGLTLQQEKKSKLFIKYSSSGCGVNENLCHTLNIKSISRINLTWLSLPAEHGICKQWSPYEGENVVKKF